MCFKNIYLNRFQKKKKLKLIKNHNSEKQVVIINKPFKTKDTGNELNINKTVTNSLLL